MYWVVWNQEEYTPRAETCPLVMGCSVGSYAILQSWGFAMNLLVGLPMPPLFSGGSIPSRGTRDIDSDRSRQSIMMDGICRLAQNLWLVLLDTGLIHCFGLLRADFAKSSDSSHQVKPSPVSDWLSN